MATLSRDFMTTEQSDGQPRRKHPVHGVILLPDQPTIVFLTVCTKDRAQWLASPDIHDLLLAVWTNAAAWLVGRYVIMPDHIHLFAALGTLELPLENWVKYWKSQFTKQHRCPEHRWQTDHWDTRLRSGQSYEDKWQYVFNNPVRHGLVERPEEWPHQGEIYELRWQ
jgi:putative transposase